MTFLVVEGGSIVEDIIKGNICEEADLCKFACGSFSLCFFLNYKNADDMFASAVSAVGLG